MYICSLNTTFVIILCIITIIIISKSRHVNVLLLSFIGYSKSYSDDLYYGKDYYLIPTNETSMQSEIMRNGSITVGFEIYADVYCYGSGEYNSGI